MIHRILAGAGALAVAAGSQAAISVSFASGSANTSHIFEINQAFAASGFGSLIVTSAANVEVDLIVNMGGSAGLFTQRAGFEASFEISEDFNPATGGPLVIGGSMQGYFRFYDPDDSEITLLVGFVGDGFGIFVQSSGPFGGGDGLPLGLVSGSLIGPGTSYFLNDPMNLSALGFPGGGIMGDSNFGLTNFEIEEAPDNGSPIVRATGSFSGTLVPSTGTGVLAGLGMGFAAARRRR